jgi:hypothetical protein
MSAQERRRPKATPAIRDVERLTRELQEKERKVAELEAKWTQGAATSQAELAQAKQALNDS